jgi:HlyD family secretion protein
MSKRRIIIPIALVVIVGGWLAWRAYRNGSDPDVIKISGNIEFEEIDMSFKLPGKLVELAVDEGDMVKAGQKLARADVAEIEQQFQGAKAGVSAADSALTQLHTAISYQEAVIQDDTAARRAELQAAEARLQEFLNGSRPQEIQQARAAVEEARSQREQARLDWQRAQTLFKDDDISKSQFDQFRMRAEVTEAALKRAEEAYALVKAGPRKEQIDQQRAQVERAGAALRASEANAIDLKRRKQEVAMREAEIERARSQSGYYQVQLNDRLMLAPVNAVVLTKSSEPGEVLAGGATVVTLGDIARPWVRGYINETKLGRIKYGMPAEITTDSYPGKTYKGKISFIASEAEFTPKQIQTQDERVKLVYRIKIDVENQNQELKSNMPVDAVIRLAPESK